MSAAQLDELPAEDNNSQSKGKGGNLVPALIAIILAPALTVGAMYVMIEINKPKTDSVSQVTQGGEPLNMEPTGEEKSYELDSLITNLRRSNKIALHQSWASIRRIGRRFRKSS